MYMNICKLHLSKGQTFAKQILLGTDFQIKKKIIHFDLISPLLFNMFRFLEINVTIMSLHQCEQIPLCPV